MQQPDDTLLRALMMKLCADRQIQLAMEVMDYALKRLDRSCAAIAGFIARIDQMALEQQRAITIPLVKQLLDEYYAS